MKKCFVISFAICIVLMLTTGIQYCYCNGDNTIQNIEKSILKNLKLEADKLEINASQGHANFSGNVTLRSDLLHLDADLLNIIYDNKHIERNNNTDAKLSIIGKMTQMKSDEIKFLSAQKYNKNVKIMILLKDDMKYEITCEKVIFDFAKQELTISNATVNDGSNTISGSKMSYSIAQQQLSVIGQKTKSLNDDNRVKVLIQ